MRGGCAPALTASRRWRSVRQTPAARTCTTTSSGPGFGFATWTTFTAPPASNRIARTSGTSETERKTICLSHGLWRPVGLFLRPVQNLQVPPYDAEAEGNPWRGAVEFGT